MRGIGFVTLFWLNGLALLVGKNLLFDQVVAANPGISLLSAFGKLSMLGVLLVVSMFLVAFEPALQRRWICLFLAAPTVVLFAATFMWMWSGGL